MSLTHRDLANLCASLYGQGEPAPWVYRSNVDANVYMGLVRRDDYLIVMCRGSFDLEDWLHDFRVKKALQAGRLELGVVHAGFYSGTPEAWDIITDYRVDDDKLIFAGHSLGAARAMLLAGHAVANGIKPALIRCWGEPASAVNLKILTGVPAISDRNTWQGEVDPVTASTLPFGFNHVVALTDVKSPPNDPKWFDPLGLHHFALYQSVTPDTPI